MIMPDNYNDNNVDWQRDSSPDIISSGDEATETEDREEEFNEDDDE